MSTASAFARALEHKRRQQKRAAQVRETKKKKKKETTENKKKRRSRRFATARPLAGARRQSRGARANAPTIETRTRPIVCSRRVVEQDRAKNKNWRSIADFGTEENVAVVHSALVVVFFVLHRCLVHTTRGRGGGGGKKNSERRFSSVASSCAAVAAATVAAAAAFVRPPRCRRRQPFVFSTPTGTSTTAAARV